MRPSRRLSCLAGTVTIAGLVVLTACSSTHKQTAKRTVRTSPTVVATTTTSPLPAFTMTHARLTASFIPPGFVTDKTTLGKAVPGHVDGPVPGWTNDAQQFTNYANGKRFIISVARGMPAGLAVAQNQSPPYVGIGPRMTGHKTYVRTEVIVGGEREITWIISSKTTGFIGGFRMTGAELLRIANGVHIAS